MENRIKFEPCWKQKAKKSVTLRTQRLFSIVRSAYLKIQNSGSGTRFPAYGTAEAVKDYEIKVEQKKVEAIHFLYRRLII